MLVNDTRVGLDKNYEFDQVFPPETTNPQVKNYLFTHFSIGDRSDTCLCTEIFAKLSLYIILAIKISNFICKPLVNAALNGFNGTVMAYGQTGSGTN